MIIYGEEGMIHKEIIGDWIQITLEIDNDHVQSDITFLVYENGINYLSIGVRIILLSAIWTIWMKAYDYIIKITLK